LWRLSVFTRTKKRWPGVIGREEMIDMGGG